MKLPGGLWIVTERAVATESGEPVDPVQAALWGLGRTAINEEPALRCKLVDCDGSQEAVRALADLLVTPVDEPEIAVRQGKLLASRLLPWARSGNLTVPRGGDYVLAPTERGAIDNLRLTEADVPPPDEGYVQVAVEAAGLNFRDVLNVLGLYPGDPGPVGGDFAGTVTQLGDGVTGLEVGQRVYGSMQGAFASRFNAPAQFLAPIPDGVSAVEAATIPAAALTVRLSFDWAKLNPGDKVLIHAASGGVGLAAIQMAQKQGAEVYATASTFKRATLRKLGVKHVYDSRTTDFADQILADTDGAGVDVVLNSLTSEGFVEATVRATAQGGRFAEIAKRDIWTPEQMAEVRPDIAYEIVALDTVMFSEPERIRGLLTEVSQGLANGEWTPLPAEVYPVTEARAAFRRMQQARHIGKIVVQIPTPLQPRADRSYLITGGLGAIGLHTAAYLAQRGAGDIVLTSRRAPDEEAQATIDDITERYGCRIHVFSADVGDESEVAELLGRIRAELPPLAGVAASGWRARRCTAVTAEPGAVPNDAGAQGVRRLPSGPLDEGRRSGLLHRVVVGVQPVRFTRAVQLRDRQRTSRRARRAEAGARLARHRRQLRSVGPGRHGVLGGRDRQYQRPRPGPTRSLGRAERALRGRRERHRPGDRHQGQLATCREGARQFASADPRSRLAECGRRGDR